MDRQGILIVEDEWLVAEEHREVLERAGYSVVGPAPSVRQAIKLIQSESIVAAVLDIGLNGETSAALLPYLEAKGIPFVFASGYVEKDVPESLRGRKILPKPVQASVLVAEVKLLLS